MFKITAPGIRPPSLCCLLIIIVENLQETTCPEMHFRTLFCCTLAIVFLHFIRHFSHILTPDMTHVDSIGFSVQPLAPPNLGLKVVGCDCPDGGLYYDVPCWLRTLPMRQWQWYGFVISRMSRIKGIAPSPQIIFCNLSDTMSFIFQCNQWNWIHCQFEQFWLIELTSLSA